MTPSLCNQMLEVQESMLDFIRAYHLARGDHHHNVCIIPVSAHGTNPASATMCGIKIVFVGTDAKGVGALLSNFGITETSASLLINVIITFSMLTCIALSKNLWIFQAGVLVQRDSLPMSSIVNAPVTATCVIVYESIFCMRFGVIPNIICAEIFPTSVKGICISICALTFWISTLMIKSSFPFLLHQIGLNVPKTKGMPLEVIIEFFAIGAKPGADPATMAS
ncbi:hypothetical protein Ahy_A08g040507 [Arachis hypogaea]|uniref:Uncharacterized protein n=1 Tax=Arachis hypogaea TaxID=3818 RepID=A0A445BZG3_ARAHY|nr:hypothetical protein Ahy_A08g040507 [Arachis hypogaea]